MNVWIVTNGSLANISNVRKYMTKPDYVICADGGIKYLEMLDIKPDILLGDFDSAQADTIRLLESQGVKIETYPPEKDFTDTHLAIEHAIKVGATSITVIGAIGTRFDHSYANVMLLYKLLKQNICSSLVNDNNYLTLADKSIEITGEIGQTISLLPFGGDAFVTQTKGLKYPIENKFLSLDNPYGISNVFVESKVIVQVDSGSILAILAWD